MKKFILLFAALLFICGCGDEGLSPEKAPAPPPLILYCGAGIRPVAEELIVKFHEKTGIKVSPSYAGSGRLLGQLTATQQGDLFMPGSGFYVDKAEEQKNALSETRKTVAYFVPVIFVQKGNPLKINNLANFAEKKLRLGLGDERAVAIGRRSYQLFKKNGIDTEKITKNHAFTSGTVNVLCVAVEMKNVDAVIVWGANARQFSKVGDTIKIPEKENIISEIPIITLSFSKQKKNAQKFIDFIMSSEGRNIFKKHKYTIKQKGKR